MVKGGMTEVYDADLSSYFDTNIGPMASLNAAWIVLSLMVGIPYGLCLPFRFA